MAEARAGHVIGDGRYELIKQLGKGSFGAVFKAQHVKLGKPVAIKILHADMGLDERNIIRFENEAKATAQLGHPNIVNVIDYGHEDGIGYYIVMEQLDGETLKDRIESKTQLEALECLPIVMSVADALNETHAKGMFHRDLKPENIFLHKVSGDQEVTKVLDFGTVLLTTPTGPVSRITRKGFVMGTPKFMSPEQAMGKELDGRSDIYSLGLILFKCLTGKLPFPDDSLPEMIRAKCTERPKSLEEVRPDLKFHSILETIIYRSLATDPANRYPTMEDMWADMDTVHKNLVRPKRDPMSFKKSGELATSGIHPTYRSPVKKDSSKSSSTLYILGGVIFVMLIVIGVLIWMLMK